MASVVFEGHVSGKNHKDLQQKAHEVAKAYFDTGCVSVVLKEPSTLGEIIWGDGTTPDDFIFEATFQAQEDHKLEPFLRGTEVCVTCKRESWPDSPLPQASWPKGWM